MGIRILGLILLLPFVLGLPNATADGADGNLSSGGPLCSTVKEEENLLRNDEQYNGDLDGGFSSLDGMLQWAISHSDPAKLKETADVRQQLSESELKKRQMELEELMEEIKVPSDAELMKIAIGDLNNSSLTSEERLRALQELNVLVEPIDNANDFGKLGGLVCVTQELYHPDPNIRTIAAWILGKVSQNNLVVQQQVLELGVLSMLMKMVKSNFIEEANKALYAVSALIRNNLAGQELFSAENGDLMLQNILRNSSIDIRLQEKALILLADLAQRQIENAHKTELPFLSDRDLLKSVVDLIAASTDLDLQDKALVAIKSLLQLRTTEALVLKDFCALGDALNKMRQLLLNVMADEFQRDYAIDVESLRSEVEYIFQRKLSK
ncbi:hsp70 nucleotide exchange factor FES1 [Neltuma alba]|uniref:hsp70 nucleotide exchange factor FES1 n=1 Tax=Neltuma alba TaxID=207710 RepID=UPI0010A4F530|nr:hsp70 nucleotide exchange factor FES1-like [Prosopis alba]